MAGTLALNVEILGEFKKLTAATKGAEGNLAGLNKTAQSISSGMIKALGAIGVGFSLGFIKNEFEQAAKAAIEDVKSQQLLAIAMENTGKATAGTVKQAEESIKRMQLQSSVADDLLRPAFQKLFIATGSVTKSNKLLQIALDTSAATGKDLDSVTQAMAKSLAGQDTALLKLIPSLRGVEDPLSELEKTFAGAAEAAADTDPYQRMQIIFGELQEQIGMALLPLLNEFSDWLATPEGQAKLQEIVDGIVDIITEMVKAVRFVEQNKDWLLPMVAAIGGVTAAWNLATVAVNGFKIAAGIGAALSGSPLLVAGAVGAGAAAGGYAQGMAQAELNRALGPSDVGGPGGLFPGMRQDIFGSPAATRPSGVFGSADTMERQIRNITVNVNSTNATPNQIVDKIKQYERQTGTKLLR
jgi:hypothetical protein